MSTVKEVNEDLAELRADFAGFRGRVETELGLFRSIAKGIADKLVALIVAIILGLLSAIGGAFVVGWQFSALSAEVKAQGKRLDAVEGRLDGMAKQLETIIRQTTPKAAP